MVWSSDVPAMSDQKTQEPSMEEILASIRRIISEEGGSQTEGEARPAVAAPAAAAPVPADAAPAQEEVLELTDVVEEDGSVSPLEKEIPAAAEPPPEAAEPAPVEAGTNDGRLLSESAAAASTSALAQLAGMMVRRDLPLGNSDRTLEGLVVELLRPMLREWLDQNLPDLIDRLVRQEIEKLVRRAEGR
jgi:cell pole-organizing protein PopZ